MKLYVCEKKMPIFIEIQQFHGYQSIRYLLEIHFAI